VTDRALHDRVIRALADAPYRASAEWRGDALAEPERVERFARFLARHFYYERVVHFFKYSRALARVTGRRPEAVLAGPAFDARFPSLVLGSRESAATVARLAAAHVRDGDGGRPPYLGDLLRYEEAMMVVEAGPRLWREASGGQHATGNAVEAVEGTVLLDLTFDLPVVLPKLLQPWTDVPEAPERPTKLLVARSPHGRVAVARSTDPVEKVLALADGRRTVEELAAGAGVTAAQLDETLRGLVEIGALRFSTGS
jgi:hypothetical protein